MENSNSAVNESGDGNAQESAAGGGGDASDDVRNQNSDTDSRKDEPGSKSRPQTTQSKRGDDQSKENDVEAGPKEDVEGGSGDRPEVTSRSRSDNVKDADSKSITSQAREKTSVNITSRKSSRATMRDVNNDDVADPDARSITSQDQKQQQSNDDARSVNGQVDDNDVNAANDVNNPDNDVNAARESKPSSRKSTRSRTSADENRMYSPDDNLNDKQYVDALAHDDDSIALSKEMLEWRQTYDVTLDEAETGRIMAGEPSLAGLGLSSEEEGIASEVVQEKLKELKVMSLQQLVDFVRLESF